MSSEESEDNNIGHVAGQQSGSEVIKTVTRRGGARKNRVTEKKLALGIKGTSALKNKKTPVKTAIKEAVHGLIDEENDDLEHKVRMDRELAGATLLVKSEPKHHPIRSNESFLLELSGAGTVRNRTLTLIEREDDSRSWEFFLVYFSHSTIMPCPPRG
jgi:hypothetical protein